MADKKHIHALAGLLADPILAEHSVQLVPSQWFQSVGEARNISLRASRLAAGTSEDPKASNLNTLLLSIFSSIRTAEGVISQPVYRAQSSLTITAEALMPKPKSDAKLSATPWKTFLTKAGELKGLYDNASDETLPQFIESLLYLLQLHTWCLPCSYQASLPDVSLYDHSRMASALATALSDYQEGEPALTQLIGGDLSGVQRFIYTITAKGATSSLRGRSFYLQLLTEAAARYTLRQLGLPLTSLIYAGGGNFYILAPAGANSLPIQEHISRVLLRHHRGELYLALASQPLQEKDFFKGEISKRWDDLTNALNYAKLRAFSELGSGLDQLFSPQGSGGNEDALCQVCGSEHPQTSAGGVRKCPPCSAYETLGRDLREAHFLAYRTIPEAPLSSTNFFTGSWKDVLAHLGLKVSLAERLNALDRDGSALTFLALDDQAYQELKPAVGKPIGRRFMVNVTPLVTPKEMDMFKVLPKDDDRDVPEVGDVKPFDMLEQQSDGIKRLGILRMDVDNLSQILRSGFGDGATLSRLGALSFAISLYFEGWVDKLARNANEEISSDGFKQRIYSIYSGGDDLFFVGSWDAIVELARRIRADLGHYAGQHPGIHASAGIVLVGGKYPLYQAAQDAGQAEEHAKALQWISVVGGHRRTKDAVAFLGQVMPWQQFGLEDCAHPEPQTVHAWAHRLQTALTPKEAPRSLLGLLMGLQEKYDKAAEEKQRQGTDLNQQRQKQAIWGPWNWQSAYFLRRMQKRSRQDSLKELLEAVLKLLQSDQFASIEWIGLAARWAELKLR